MLHSGEQAAAHAARHRALEAWAPWRQALCPTVEGWWQHVWWIRWRQKSRHYSQRAREGGAAVDPVEATDLVVARPDLVAEALRVASSGDARPDPSSVHVGRTDLGSSSGSVTVAVLVIGGLEMSSPVGFCLFFIFNLFLQTDIVSAYGKDH